MRRGTTPTIIITAGCDLTDLKSIYITLKQDNVELTKDTEHNQLVIKGNKIHVFLTQVDTLLFKPRLNVQVQMRAVTNNGIVIASSIKPIPVEDILKEGVIV